MNNTVETLRNVRAYARHAYTDLGGYPLVLVMADGECLCSKRASENYRLISQATRTGLRDGWKAEGVQVHWEGETEICAHCYTEIESAYGNQQEEQQ